MILPLSVHLKNPCFYCVVRWCVSRNLLELLPLSKSSWGVVLMAMSTRYFIPRFPIIGKNLIKANAKMDAIHLAFL